MTAPNPSRVRALQEVWEEPPEVFARRLVIENDKLELQRMDPLFVEQLAYVEALIKHKRVVAIKPRQVGFTTAATLFLFAKTYRSANPRQVLQTVQDPAAGERVRRMVDVAYAGLPRALQFGVKVNAQRTEFQHNKAVFRRAVAGKRGQGRSFTFSDYHATEMAFYPEGSSALKGSDEKVDSDLFASVQSAMHDPTGHIIVESTGNGPRGLFHRLVKHAQKGIPDVGFVFLPWTASPRYRAPVPEGWEPTDEEADLAMRHGLTPEQLQWRRLKLTIGGYTLVRFRREYPLTWLDPFLPSDTGSWFSALALNEMAALVHIDTVNEGIDGIRVFLEPEEGRKYYLSCDPSGGVGRDEAVIHVLRDDLEHVATWASNTTHPKLQALMLARLAHLYNNGLCLVEANKYGTSEENGVIPEAERLGCRMWKDEEERHFYATGHTGGDRKRGMMLHARTVLDNLETRPKDVATIMQLQIIVEKAFGKIEGMGEEHDDRAIAFCLALWCARRYSLRVEQVDSSSVRAENQRKAVEDFMKKFGGVKR